MKILLVEDEFEKRRLLMEAILDVPGMTTEVIYSAEDALSAKKLLSEHKFNLLILDINVPMRAARRPEVGAGLDILSYIRNNNKALAPSYIIGMSSYDDAISSAARDFAFPIWRLIKFSHEDLAWKEPLQQALAYLLKQDVPPYGTDGRTFRIDLGIVVALEDDEMQSIRNLDGGWEDIVVPYDAARYILGKFESSGESLHVVAVACPRMGMPSAAVTASKLIHTFRPEYLAISGICAGVRGKVKMGDILVADPCFDWGSGKWVRDMETGKLKFRPASYPWRLDEDIRSGIKAVADTPALLRKIYDSFTGPKPALAPEVIIDAMASGSSVLQASELMEEIAGQHKNLIGIEMENYAVFTAAEYASKPRPKCFSVKAVCDFGDDQKGDGFHAYAAHVSAQFLYNFALQRLAKSGNQFSGI